VEGGAGDGRCSKGVKAAGERGGSRGVVSTALRTQKKGAALGTASKASPDFRVHRQHLLDGVLAVVWALPCAPRRRAQPWAPPAQGVLLHVT